MPFLRNIRWVLFLILCAPSTGAAQDIAELESWLQTFDIERGQTELCLGNALSAYDRWLALSEEDQRTNALSDIASFGARACTVDAIVTCETSSMRDECYRSIEAYLETALQTAVSVLSTEPPVPSAAVAHSRIYLRGYSRAYRQATGQSRVVDCTQNGPVFQSDDACNSLKLGLRLQAALLAHRLARRLTGLEDRWPPAREDTGRDN